MTPRLLQFPAERIAQSNPGRLGPNAGAPPTSLNPYSTEPLFQPLTLRSVTFKNRIGVAPMCQYSAVDGFANAWHFAHAAQYAIHGVGLFLVEATGVLPNGRISPNCLGLYSQGHADALKPLTEFIKSQGCVPGIQLAHAGLKASTLSPFKKTGNAVLASLEVGGWIDNVVGPTAGKLSPELADARALSITEIKEIVEAFANAAKYALDAGFSVVEVHGAHGYLIHSFLSPFSNKRTDEYGGSFENRARLAVEVCQAVRKVWPDNLPLFFRTSATDWAEDGQIGFTPEDAVRLAVLLKNTAGVDVVNCSSGGLFTPKDPSVLFQEGYNVSFSKRIRKESGISTAVAGMITRANHANGIISEGSADLVLLAREFLRNPNWVFDAAKELGAEIEWPVQYRRGKPRD